MQGLSCGNVVQLEQIASFLHERGQLDSSVSNANQRLSKVDLERHSIKIEKRAHVATFDLQALEFKSINAEIGSFENLLANHDDGCKIPRKRRRCGDAFTSFPLSYVLISSRALYFVPVFCVSKTSELWRLGFIRKQQWSRRSKFFCFCQCRHYITRCDVRNVFLPFSCAKRETLSFSLWQLLDFLKEKVLQEMTTNE